MKNAIVAVALVCGLQLAAAPANALKTLPGADVTFVGGSSSMTLFGSKAAPDVVISARTTTPRADAATAVPEPAGWLMMLIGFGLLGVMTRRGAPSPVEIHQSI